MWKKRMLHVTRFGFHVDAEKNSHTACREGNAARKFREQEAAEKDRERERGGKKEIWKIK